MLGVNIRTSFGVSVDLVINITALEEVVPPWETLRRIKGLWRIRETSSTFICLLEKKSTMLGKSPFGDILL